MANYGNVLAGNLQPIGPMGPLDLCIYIYVRACVRACVHIYRQLRDVECINKNLVHIIINYVCSCPVLIIWWLNVG